MFDPVAMSLTLMPLLFIVLIFLTYLNVLESKRTKNLDEKLGLMSEYMKQIANNFKETPEKPE
jgi:hypothetical protein